MIPKLPSPVSTRNVVPSLSRPCLCHVAVLSLSRTANTASKDPLPVGEPDLTLFYSPGACSLAPHIVLHEVGIPFSSIRVAIADGEHCKPEYLAVNPRGRVSALRIGGASRGVTATDFAGILDPRQGQLNGTP